jgi:hypothetical protein
MDSRADLLAKLADLNAKLNENPQTLSPEERQKHLDALKGVMDAMGSMAKDLKKAVDESNPDACTLRVIGKFQRKPDGSFLYPTKEEVQQRFREFHNSLCVRALNTERNFNYLQKGPGFPDYLVQEEELFIIFGSAEDTQYVLDCNFNLHVTMDMPPPARCRVGSHITFAKPTPLRRRDTYRAIGQLITRLKAVDGQCKALGAIPGRGGIPTLPDEMVQAELFDDTVKALEENINDLQGKLGRNIQDPTTAKQTLHGFLCSRKRVDKRKRQNALDPLVDARIEILKALAKMDCDQFPFTYEPDFK